MPLATVVLPTPETPMTTTCCTPEGSPIPETLLALRGRPGASVGVG